MTSVATARSPWIVRPAPNPAARLRLLCFPHAGGGASVYSTWPRALPSEVEVCAVQMPGREERLSESPIAHWPEALEGLTDALMPFTARPFALFGHSLGAHLAFELARGFRRAHRPGPLHLFVSGCRAPHLPLDEPLTYNLPEPEFVDELRQSAGTPGAVLECAELLEIYMPVLRADFRLADLYAYQEAAPLAVPISAYGGIEDDDVTEEKLEAWREHTTSAFRRVMFGGGHFFVNERRTAVLTELSRELRTIAACLA